MSGILVRRIEMSDMPKEAGVPSAVAVFLEAEMKKRGWQPSDLASKAELRPSTLSYILNTPRAIPRPEAVKALAGALEVDASLITSLAGYPIEASNDPDGRYAVIGRQVSALPWLAERVTDFLALSQEEFQGLMDYLDFRRSRRSPHRDADQSSL